MLSASEMDADCLQLDCLLALIGDEKCDSIVLIASVMQWLWKLSIFVREICSELLAL
jgi:hypothetical protein